MGVPGATLPLLFQFSDKEETVEETIACSDSEAYSLVFR